MDQMPALLYIPSPHMDGPAVVIRSAVRYSLTCMHGRHDLISLSQHWKPFHLSSAVFHSHTKKFSYIPMSNLQF